MPPKTHILIRSSWQTVNIGDIAHTPGLLALLERHLPDTRVTLWPGSIGNGVEALLLDRFPTLSIIRSDEDRDRAFEECDFLLHSSGASVVAQGDLVRWAKATGKPYGVYGISFPRTKSWQTEPLTDAQLAEAAGVLSGADFVYFRDSKSLQLAKDVGCTCPLMAFGPDAAFACDLRDDAKADAFLAEHRLEPGRFLCCIPRYRYTPTWLMPWHERPLDPIKHARNEAMKEHDHAPLRQSIIDVVRQTDMKILLCPEDQTQMQIGKALLLDPLPGDVRERVVWRPDYWLTGEAISTYRRSAGLFGNEMHSPIMCIGHGIPAIVCRWAEQTTKGFMWQDIGLGDWLFDLDDESQLANIPPTVLDVARNPAAAAAKAAAANQRVLSIQAEQMQFLAERLRTL